MNQKTGILAVSFGTSHNTTRLDVEGTVTKLLTTDYVREQLAMREDSKWTS